MFCSKCGTKAGSSDDKFCSSCGAKLQTKAEDKVNFVYSVYYKIIGLWPEDDSVHADYLNISQNEVDNPFCPTGNCSGWGCSCIQILSTSDSIPLEGEDLEIARGQYLGDRLDNMQGLVTWAEAHLQVQFPAGTFGKLKGEELSEAVIERCEEISLWLPWESEAFEEVITWMDGVGVEPA